VDHANAIPPSNVSSIFRPRHGRRRKSSAEISSRANRQKKKRKQ
jgi:hypothetical protein